MVACEIRDVVFSVWNSDVTLNHMISGIQYVTLRSLLKKESIVTMENYRLVSS